MYHYTLPIRNHVETVLKLYIQTLPLISGSRPVIQSAPAIIFKPRHLNETVVMPQDQKQEHQEGADCGERDPQCGKLESYLMLLFGLVFGCYLCSADT